MHRLVVARRAGILEARAFEHPAKVFERYPAVDLHQGALDDVLELNRVDCPDPLSEGVAPGVRANRPALRGPIT